MGKFNEYTQKATPADNDTLMIYDATSKANKLSPFSGIWNWIVGKLTNAVISNLQTNNKSVVGALNELNRNRLAAYARGTYDEVKIGAKGYASLAKDDIDLSECKFATMVNYSSINPKTAITIYASPHAAYVLGEPDTTIYGLKVDFWK